MDHFNQAVEELKQQNALPIMEVKKRYTATRAALVQEWKTFLKHKPTLEAIFQEAQVRHQEAIGVGVYYPDLARNLARVYGHEGVTGTLQAMQGNYDYALGKIDGLNEKDLNFPNILAGLYNEPARLHDNLNQLEKVAKKVEEQLK